MNFFKQLRIARKLSQEELSDATGVSQPVISKIEHGKPVERENLEKVCTFFGIQLDAVPNVRIRERNLR